LNTPLVVDLALLPLDVYVHNKST